MLSAITLVAVLLLVGVVLRRQWSLLAAARIPACLVAGGIGLAGWQAMLAWAAAMPESALADRVAGFETGAIAQLRSWPRWLIAVVFAGMLLSKSSPNGTGDNAVAATERFGGVAREALMVWIIVLGQTTVGLWLTWWIVQPRYGLPNSAAALIETGLAGGHGTAAAMGAVLEHPTIGLPEGLDLGILMATGGLIYGLIAGMACIHLGLQRGWTAGDRADDRASDETGDSFPGRGGEAKAAAKPGSSAEASLGQPRIGGDALDPLLLQAVWLMLAFAIGVGLQTAVGSIAGGVDATGWVGSPSESGGDSALRSRLTVAGIVGSFPLFIYTLFGGAIVRFVVIRVAGETWIDHDTIGRLVGSSMDLLVVAAVVTLNLAAVASLWGAFLILFVGGVVWSTFCLLFLAKRILPEPHWFELGLINFGMSTGTTATGFVLLRVVDPNLRTAAAEHYALAAPLSAPFIGGGILTVGLPLIIFQSVPIAVSTWVFTVILAVFIAIGVRHKSKIDS